MICVYCGKAISLAVPMAMETTTVVEGQLAHRACHRRNQKEEADRTAALALQKEIADAQRARTAVLEESVALQRALLRELQQQTDLLRKLTGPTQETTHE